MIDLVVLELSSFPFDDEGDHDDDGGDDGDFDNDFFSRLDPLFQLLLSFRPRGQILDVKEGLALIIRSEYKFRTVKRLVHRAKR